MTRRISIAIAAIVLSSLVLCGATDEEKYRVHVVKWYEDLSTISGKYGVPEDVIININGLQNKKVATRQQLLIPTSEKYWTIASSSPEGGNEAETENVAEEYADTLSAFPVSTVKFALAMPLDGRKESNGNNMDFYSGALMAVRALGKEGLDVEINVRNLNDPQCLEDSLAGNDFVIGPIHNNDMAKLLEKVNVESVVVSPLDNRSGNTFGKNHRFFVQAAASLESQFSEAFVWAKDVFETRDNVKYVIISSEMDKATLVDAENAASNANLAYSVYKTGVQGDIIGWDITDSTQLSGNKAVILAITNEAVLNNAVRNMDILVPQGNVTVFAGSKIRSYETIPVENLHKADIHALCPYYVDYDDAATLDFIHQYRALFNIEPSQFAFQGYDLVYFMVKSYAKYGRNWKYLISADDAVDMLQTSFKIRRAANGVLTNCGMKRVLYGTDYRVKLSK